MDEGIIELGTAAAVELAASSIAARAGKKGRCANCNTALIGPYCANCGQAATSTATASGGCIHECSRTSSISTAASCAPSSRCCSCRASLPCAFREGRTQRYVPALRLYLFVSLIFFILLSISGIALMQFEVTVQQKVDVEKVVQARNRRRA